MSLLGNIVRSSKKEAGGGAGGLTAANNGTSVSGTTVQLGNDTGLATAILLNNREIPMGGFSFLMHSGGNDQLLIDPAGRYKMGDLSVVGNGNLIDIDDAGGRTDIYSDDFHVRGRPGSKIMLALWQSGGIYQMGDINISGNHIYFEVDDAQQKISIYKAASRSLFIDLVNGSYQFGDTSTAANGTRLVINDATQDIKLFCGSSIIEVIDNGSFQFIDLFSDGGATNAELLIQGDANENAELIAANGLKISNSDGILLHFGAALTNGAAAQVGTLTNAPAAGNPTKWVPIDDNGTTRFIPAW